MRRHFRILALALTLGATSAVYAQAQPGNPTGRGGPDRDPFAGGSLNQPTPRNGDVGRNNFGQHGLARGQPRNGGSTVTPIPEPGQWAMMLAGLALVGFIVRRNSKRK